MLTHLYTTIQVLHSYSVVPNGEVLFPGLDLDSGLDWTLDWTLEKMYFWCHCLPKRPWRGPMPCPLGAQTLNHVHVRILVIIVPPTKCTYCAGEENTYLDGRCQCFSISTAWCYCRNWKDTNVITNSNL